MQDSYIVITLIVISALVAKEIGIYIVKKIIKKVDTDYVTLHNCAVCKNEKTNDIKELKKEMREKLSAIGGILLVLATGKEVPSGQIEKFMEKLMGVMR